MSGQRAGEDDRVKRDFPSDRFFAGALSPRSENQLETTDDDLQSKMEPNAIGSTVKIRGGGPGDELVVDISGSVWVRVNPTYEEMDNRDNFVSLGDREEDEEAETDLLPVFERFDLDVPSIKIPYEALSGPARETPEVVRERANEALADAFEDVRVQAQAHDDIYLDPGDEHPDDDVPHSALADEEAYEDYLEEREGEPAIPHWNGSLELTSSLDRESDRDDQLIVDVEFENTADHSKRDAIYTIRDPTLFEVQLDLRTEGDVEFVPFTFDPLPEDFRYNRDLWGHGRNCTVRAPDQEETMRDGRTPGRRAPQANPTADHLQTQFIPEHRQLVYESADRDVEASFSELSSLDDGGFEVLDAVAQAMRDYHQEAYDTALEQYQEREDWDADGRDENDFMEDRKAFLREIRRFERGIRCLRDHPESVGRAFELMNETMDRMHDFDSWRLFQLVFIVMLVPDIASREHEGWEDISWRDGDEMAERFQDADGALDVVDVLWFPTGGGKTEAFLGVAVWNMFFDRIRGKHFGVAAWTRFPLRLLSLQQLQRMSETVVYADVVRREQPEIGSRPSRPFSVGFLVGKANTPNALTGYDNDNFSRYQDDPDLREDAKVIPSCPACGSDIEMRVTDDIRLAHVCTGNPFDCDWQSRETTAEETYAEDELPVHVVDNELYRYAPTILAGTIDKITAIGYQRKMAHILTGEMEYECPIHGFASLGECTEKYGCDIDRDEFEVMASPIDVYDPAPSLMVPDELHLLEESVGSFDGHYETGVDTLQELVDAGQTKIIAPTATITAYEDQVYHLFLRPAERFPAPGPYLRENFYAQEQAESQRYYIGLIPHGKTHINSIIDILFYFHREVQDLMTTAMESPEDLLTGVALEGTDTSAPLNADSIDEVLQTLTLYSTSLTYLLSKKDGDRLDQSIVSQLNAYLRRDDRPPLASERMTGGTPFEKVQDILDLLDNPWQEDEDRGILQSLVDDDVLPPETQDAIMDLRDTLEASLDDATDVESDEFRVALRQADEDVREGLAWLLASRLNTITATSMISHGVDVERFNMMVFFGMPRQTAEYIQSSSRAGRSHPGLVFNVFHPIRERDLSHYHFFEKYHQFLDRLVEPVSVNRWAKNSVQRTHPGLFMSLLLNHYMYRDGSGKLFFGDSAEDFLAEVDDQELEDLITRMYGGDEVPEEFGHDAEELTNLSISQIQLDDQQWTSNRLPRGAMRSLRDVDEQLPIRSEYKYRDLLETLENQS
ncbi:helicase-related protein [Halobacterium salinarum]|uniref:helicase-related protein n=1 Tax=Halobacterium salinarum TaxID=2242 RepID=UPI002554F38F|nr:helicase-related protein [Halobacterium salinarum]MDL0133790.1 helicase-related protein [Halobacterium salinarum]